MVKAFGATPLATMPSVLSLLRQTHRQRRHLWVALFAVLWLALAPTLSHALAAARGGDPWREICSVQGAQRAEAKASMPTGELAAEVVAQHLFDHCPMCGLPALQGPPPAAHTVVFTDPRGHALPERFLSAPHGQHAWRPAAARAPPLPL